MSDAAGRHDRARDLPGRARTGAVDDALGARAETRSLDRAGAPGLGNS